MNIDDSKGIVRRLRAQNNRLHAENRTLRKKLDSAIDKASGDNAKRCGECSQSWPDSLMVFGDGDGNLTSLCGACARSNLHRAGIPHYANGCPECGHHACW